MTVGENNDLRERLVRIETLVDDIRTDVHETKKEISSMKLNNAKMGGALLAVTSIGGLIGWAISTFKGFWG